MLDAGVAEANHRIANNLALIAGLMRFQATRLPQDPSLPTENVRSLLQKMSARIDAVGRLHRLLTEGNGHAAVDLSKYLHEIADAAMCSLSRKDQTEIWIDLDPNCVVSARQAIAVGLVVGEAITNALKYSHPTGAPEVADDGVGLPEDFDPNTSESTGMVLMRNLAEQLSARLEFEQPPIGLCVRLELPPSSE
jgi:two-component sensor histidine kinase